MHTWLSKLLKWSLTLSHWSHWVVRSITINPSHCHQIVNLAETVTNVLRWLFTEHLATYRGVNEMLWCAAYQKARLQAMTEKHSCSFVKHICRLNQLCRTITVLGLVRIYLTVLVVYWFDLNQKKQHQSYWNPRQPYEVNWLLDCEKRIHQSRSVTGSCEVGLRAKTTA